MRGFQPPLQILGNALLNTKLLFKEKLERSNLFCNQFVRQLVSKERSLKRAYPKFMTNIYYYISRKVGDDHAPSIPVAPPLVK